MYFVCLIVNPNEKNRAVRKICRIQNEQYQALKMRILLIRYSNIVLSHK